MKHYQMEWQTAFGCRQFAQGWEPENGKPKAVILIVHGLGEHSGRYANVAEFLVQKGWAVLALDRCGHGKSEGKRGHIARYEHLLDEVVKLQTEATRRYSSLPVFLYGHSMGGGIVLNYLLRKGAGGLKGLIATGPALKLAFEPSAVIMSLGRMMRKIYPGFSQNNQLDLTQISRDPAIVAQYETDPLVHDRLSSETGIGMLEWGHWALEQAAKKPQTPCPLLLMHGGADGITSHKGTEEFAQNMQGDVTLKIWDGLYHEIHNEPEKEAVLNYLADWIQSKLKA